MYHGPLGSVPNVPVGKSSISVNSNSILLTRQAKNLASFSLLPYIGSLRKSVTSSFEIYPGFDLFTIPTAYNPVHDIIFSHPDYSNRLSTGVLLPPCPSLNLFSIRKPE